MAVSLDLTADVATVTVDRPKHLNALNLETLHELQTRIDEAADADARCLVLEGAGDDAFIAGADIQEMADFSVAEAQEHVDLGQEVVHSLETFDLPTIAAIDGYAFGGGMELALACDLRVASEGSLMGQTELDLGIMPAWGATQRLPDLVGDELARRLVYFSERVDARDALEYGLVGEVVAPGEIDERVSDLAETLASRPRHALSATKAAFDLAGTGSDEGGRRYEGRAWASLFGTEDQAEGMRAFSEDREPEFE
jgi:enoyl-CoA hydratase